MSCLSEWCIHGINTYLTVDWPIVFLHVCNRYHMYHHIIYIVFSPNKCFIRKFLQYLIKVDTYNVTIMCFHLICINFLEGIHQKRFIPFFTRPPNNYINVCSKWKKYCNFVKLSSLILSSSCNIGKIILHVSPGLLLFPFPFIVLSCFLWRKSLFPKKMYHLYIFWLRKFKSQKNFKRKIHLLVLFINLTCISSALK